MTEQKPNILLTSESIQIRQFEYDDTKDFIAFMTETESTRFLTFDEAQKTPAGATELLKLTIDSYNTNEPQFAYAVDDCTTSKFIGFCGLKPHDKETIEIMYAIMPAARGKGYATEVAKILSQYAINQLGYKKVIAPISPENKISKTVVIKAGFIDHGLKQIADDERTIHLFVFEQD